MQSSFNPRVGFIVTNRARPAERVLQPGWHSSAMDQGGKGAIKWTGRSCRSFMANAAASSCAYNLGNLVRTLVMPKTAEPWSLTSLREKADQDRCQGGQPRPLSQFADEVERREPTGRAAS